MSETQNEVPSERSGRPIRRRTLFGVPLELPTMLAVPAVGVVVALLLPWIQIFRELLR